MTPEFNIGDTVWLGSWESVQTTMTCPDCGGDGRIRCLLHDDSMVSVDCAGCSRGYEKPAGYLLVYDRAPMAKAGIVTGMSVRDDKIEYQTTAGYSTHCFIDRGAAMDHAKEIAAQADRDERDRIQKKEKDTRSWAWNVHYHRRAIREAQRQLEYHTAKLNVAKIKAKEPAEVA